MPHLIAQGSKRHHRWRRELRLRQNVILGRTDADWCVPWDRCVSRRHVELTWTNDQLHVHVLSSATNPVFFGGMPSERFVAKPGDHFVIGNTSFTVVDERAEVSLNLPNPATQQTFSADYLRQISFRNAKQQIEVLSRLPEIIAGAASDDELFVRLVNILLAGIPQSKAAAVVMFRDGPNQRRRTEVLHWDHAGLDGPDFRPSQRLILEAITKKQSVVHVWRAADVAADGYTLNADLDWAFCTPVGGASCTGWAIYMAGSSNDSLGRAVISTPTDLQDALKFAELAATTVGSVCDVRMLQRRESALLQFFSPPVMEAVSDADPDVALAPREIEVSVLFCDLRGFSRQSEESADDLIGLLNRVSDSLGLTTRHILEEGGVIGDFHGDATMGFWGWPLAQHDIVQRACRAALRIRAAFEDAAHSESHALSDFRIGIGIATGRAVAGKIGTVDQVKVTVFGPVVNIASRLEGMTNSFGAATLIDANTAYVARRELANESRIRPVATVRPYGMKAAIEVFELLPPQSVLPRVTQQHLDTYEQALVSFVNGDWMQAKHLLDRIDIHDEASNYLRQFIASMNDKPPENWDGVIPLSSK